MQQLSRGQAGQQASQAKSLLPRRCSAAQLGRLAPAQPGVRFSGRAGSSIASHELAARRGLARAAAAAAAAAPATPQEAHAPGYYFREMSPWPTDVPIVAHDPAAAPRVDLVIAGAGPSGLAVGERVARAGFKVAIIDPAPLGIWPNNYGVWVDEFEAMGLGDCLEVIWPKATVHLDSNTLGQK
jgi:lycopene beta-cyclase